jgi:hypothetical protein
METQGQGAVALGYYSGAKLQGQNSIAIGSRAGANDSAGAPPQPDNIIILNASGLEVNGTPGLTGAFYVTPVREDRTQTVPLMYNPTTYEIVQGATMSGVGAVNQTLIAGYGITITVGPDGTTIGSQYGTNIAIGDGAALNGQTTGSIAIGPNAGGLPGASGQGNGSIAIGRNAAPDGQSSESIAIGDGAGGGVGGFIQGASSIAIGAAAAYRGQGANSIAIGGNASFAYYQPSNSIILGNVIEEAPQSGSFYVSPIRSASSGSGNTAAALFYNQVSGEIYCA